jgi:hypothetical protein
LLGQSTGTAELAAACKGLHCRRCKCKQGENQFYYEVRNQDVQLDDVREELDKCLECGELKDGETDLSWSEFNEQYVRYRGFQEKSTGLAM